MSVKVRWERNNNPLASGCAGWKAYVGDHYVGTVYVDGDAFFGTPLERVRRFPNGGLPYPQPLAAQALVRYVDAGGR